MGKNTRLNKSDGRLTQEYSDKNGLHCSKNSSHCKGKNKSRKPGPKTKSVKENINLVITSSKSDKRFLYESSSTDSMLEQQQSLLNIFESAFASSLTADNFTEILQEIKDALFERDFNRAFSKPQYLETYAARWSPSRALCYHSLFIDLHSSLKMTKDMVMPDFSSEDNPSQINFRAENSSPFENFDEVVCFGGGAAEVVAFAGLLHYLKNNLSQQNLRKIHDNIVSLTNENNFITLDTKYSVRLVDSAQWQDVIHKLSHTLTKLPTASIEDAAIDPESQPSFLSPSDINFSFLQENILALSLKQIVNLCGRKPTLVTILFTLNELYVSSISKTTDFLLNLTLALKSGSLLLVVDSPGSYSETSIGSCKEKYPISWLLDYILLTKSSEISKDTCTSWIKIITEKSQWFRIPDSLKYAIHLENMRYQIHMYRRA
ncbi:25S rRNA methyltransferase [Erysiphe necator]|nr:25S rRNA methyltransferase [Erysiphe necator]